MELWDIYDINKEKTGRTIDRYGNEKLKEGEYHLVVQSTIINDDGKLLLGKRAEFKKSFPLMWECTSGSVIKGETSIQAILREVREELGLNFTEQDAKFYKTIKSDYSKYFKDIWVFKKKIDNKDIKFTDGEVIDFKWVTIDEFDKMCSDGEIVPTINFTKEDYYKCIDN